MSSSLSWWKNILKIKNKYGFANLVKMPIEEKESSCLKALIQSNDSSKARELETAGLCKSTFPSPCWSVDSIGLELPCESLTYVFLAWLKSLMEFTFVDTFIMKDIFERAVSSTPTITLEIEIDI